MNSPFDDLQCEDIYLDDPREMDTSDNEPPEDGWLESAYEDRFADYGTEDASCLGDE